MARRPKAEVDFIEEMEEVMGRLNPTEKTCFRDEIKVYVPYDCRNHACTAPRQERLRQVDVKMQKSLIDTFGGATVYKTMGFWKDEDGNLHEDYVKVYEIGHCMDKPQFHALRQSIKQVMGDLGGEYYISVKSGTEMGIYPAEAYGAVRPPIPRG